MHMRRLADRILLKGRSIQRINEVYCLMETLSLVLEDERLEEDERNVQFFRNCTLNYQVVFLFILAIVLWGN